ncbi:MULTISPECIES: efflux RND transporter periplasmic adaptor subunit [Pseudoalteromonas]|uniref:efflux RND transporter periplasmic adaptor subunit n=1 Tax=Pseudoalteromonas TaxID=53246 RepID=UPI001E4BCEF8|nr:MULTISPECIES: efflux RND transporter periplasmic adaptor subunit [Pseudoalteromonas]
MNIYKYCWYVCLMLFSAFSSAAETVNVVTQQVEQQQLAPKVTLTGSLKAQRHAQLSVLAEGVVTDIYAEAGQYLKQGEPLLALDSALIKAQLQANKAAVARAQVTVDDAKRRYTEAQSLSKQKLFAETELAQRYAAVKGAQASLLEAQANETYQQQLLVRHQLVAPFSGIIAKRMVNVGEWVTRGQSAFELVNNDKLWLDLYMPQEHFAAIDIETIVEVYLASRPNEAFTATVIAKVPVINITHRSFLLRLQLNNTGDLQVGLSASAAVSLKPTAKASVVIDRDALLRHPDGGFSVFTVLEGVAVRQSVQVGARMNSQVEVIEGLKAGQWVVTQGNELLQDGQAVKAISPTGIQ